MTRAWRNGRHELWHTTHDMTRGGRTRVRSGRQKRIQLTETWFEKMSVYQQVCPCPPRYTYR